MTGSMDREAGAPASPGRAARVLALVAAAQLLWGGLYVARTGFGIDGERVFSLWDDAMISMTYARNLAEGHGLVWNAGGERVQGITNLGPTLVMAAVHLLPLPAERTALAMQLVALLLWLALPPLAWRSARDLFPGAAAAPVLAALALPASASLGVWILQGSDAGFVAVWLMAGLALLARAERAGRGWPPALALLVALGPWIRPDLVPPAALFVAWALAFPEGRGRALLLGGAALGASGLAYLAFGQLYYGDPLPNTWYLKATGVPRAQLLAEGARQIGALLPLLLPLLGLSALALALAPRRRVAWLAAAQVATALLWAVWIGGDWTIDRGSRFVTPALAPLMVLAGGGAALASERWLAALASPARLAAGIAAVVACAVFASPRAARAELFDPGAPTLHREELRESARLAAYLRQHTAADTRIGVTWAGTLIYLARRPGVDLLGKSDPHVARLEVTRHLPGHSKWDWDHVVGTVRPEVIASATRGLGRRDDFRAAYLHVRAGEGVAFFLRRDARERLRDPRARLFAWRGGEWRPAGAAGSREP